MKINNLLLIVILFVFNSLYSYEFTISTYNCGGLSNHYDYLRAAMMQKLMQERYIAEPANMALHEKIQKLALKILFSQDLIEKKRAQEEWIQLNYQELFEKITQSPNESTSINKPWYEKSESMITSYKIRPVIIFDKEVKQRIQEHIQDLCKEDELDVALEMTRAIMAKRIFERSVTQDIICLQEANYLSPELFPQNYTVLIADSSHSKNGVAWNNDRFEHIETIGDLNGRAFAVQLLDKMSGQIVAIASGHLTGCNPYRVERDPHTGIEDSAKGDLELQTLITTLEDSEADLLIIGMDSNVTPLHPRLQFLKMAEYMVDYENFFETTCTSPYQILNNRLDWIALKTRNQSASIINIPLLDVGLNNLQTNISDHKPIAAKIIY